MELNSWRTRAEEYWNNLKTRVSAPILRTEQGFEVNSVSMLQNGSKRAAGSRLALS